MNTNLNTIWLSISAGSGPEECAYAASLTVQVILQDAQNRSTQDITIRVIESESACEKGNIRSALLAIEGLYAKTFAESWAGIVQWVWKSAYRPHHKRKNWFVQVKPYVDAAGGNFFSPSDVRFETARAGGPGGQYVNKTESAVRAVHIPTGKSATAREERSQLMNKRLALAKLAALFQEEQLDREKESRSALRQSHYELERGNPIKVYDGETMKLIKELRNGTIDE